MKIRKSKKSPSILQNQCAVAVSSHELALAVFAPAENASDEPEAREVIVERFSLKSPELGISLPAQIKEWADENKIVLSVNTQFFLNCSEHHEHSKLLSLTAAVQELPEENLIAWILDSARKNSSGADGKPVIKEVDFKSVSYTHYRLPNGKIGLTSVPRKEIPQAAARVLDDVLGADRAALAKDVALNLQIETPIRAIARYYFENFKQPAPDSATGFLAINDKGYAFGLYAANSGDLIVEAAETFEQTDINAVDFLQNVEHFPVTEDEIDSSSYRDKVLHAISEMQSEFADLSRFELEKLTEVVWVTSHEMRDAFNGALAEQNGQLDFLPVSLDVSVEEAIACGLLLAGVPGILPPPLNLIRDLIAQSQEDLSEIQNIAEQRESQQRVNAAIALLLPFLVLVAIAAGLMVDTYRASSALADREQINSNKSNELAPTLLLWNSYNERYKFYDDYTKNIVKLRLTQDRAIKLFTELDQRYPLALDGSFYVSDMKLASTGALELKGMAKDQNAITAFVQSLESSKTVNNGQYQKTFGALTFELQKDAKDANAGISSAPGAPEVVVWNVKGIYAPLDAPAPLASATGANPQPVATAPVKPSALVPANGLKPGDTIKTGGN